MEEDCPIVLNNVLANNLYIKAFMDRIHLCLFKDPNGIHGICHAKRVLLLSNCLLYLSGDQSDINKSILSLASIYHDIGRKFDGNYKSHGKSSWRKVEKFELLKGEQIQTIRIVRYIIENHSIDDDAKKVVTYYQITDIDSALYLLDLFKDADALDRIRIKDLNTSLLRRKESKEMIMVARYLFHNIEKLHI
ncbi:MAG: HD domain-containing protein [Clostridia bacterium]|nr:HD domain-containing protein [Clostridia bacterium]